MRKKRGSHPVASRSRGKTKMNEAEFKQACLDQGYGAAEALECEPNMTGDMHTHEFSAFAMVTRGEFTVMLENGPVTHKPGEVCKVDAGTLHAEQSGADGATLLVGKK
jgi:quercetin dioxygenase-like cupin family protein